MNKEYWKKFACAAAVRSVKTMAQVAGSMIIIGAFNETAWTLLWQTAVVSGIASLFTSIATGLPEVKLPSAEE